jgi:hypothetical protein
MNINKTLGIVTTTLLAYTALQPAAVAQSSDALLKKLVEKGIITTKEAEELAKEAERDFTKAYQAKSGMPNWVTSLKFNGDFRPRYEGQWSDNDLAVQRDRFRYRLRLGVTAALHDNFEIGMRLTSGDAPSGFSTGNPLSGSTTFQDNGSRKGVFLDMAYAKWSPLNGPDLSGNFTVGKMENPFAFTQVMFDPDYNPEGVAAQLAYRLNDHHSLKLVGGGFALDELTLSTRDPYLVGAQLLWDAKWSEQWQSSLSVAALEITSQETLTTTAVPDINRGNTRLNGTNGPAVSFTPIVADASLTYNLDSFPAYKGHFPIKIGGEYIYNTEADKKMSAFAAGVTLGKAGKKGLWELSYQYRYIEADSWFEELPDDDFNGFYVSGRAYRGGTNLRGHVVKASYSPFDSLTLNVLLYDGELITNPNPNDSTSRADHILVDAVWKF